MLGAEPATELEPTTGFASGSELVRRISRAPPNTQVTVAYPSAQLVPLTPHRAAARGAPERFGKYVVGRHLADGGMAEVYLARASGIEGFEKTVVIKRLKPELASNAIATELFLQEARIAATLEHPQIAQVYDVGALDGSYFFAMEHVDGADLRAVMNTAARAERAIPLEDALRIITELCGALHYAHEKHGPDGEHLALVHRDVSPSNVLISYDGAVKLCDFGVAEVAAARKDPKKRIVAGKLSYMSPEQCRGDTLDRRSDIFVLAVVLYELTTLTKLFKGATDHEVARQIVEGRVAPPSAIRASYPPELERIVMRGLALAPDDRYATAQEMRLDLEAFAREHKLALSAVRLAMLMGGLFPADLRGGEIAPHSASDFGHAPVVELRPPRPWYRAWLAGAVLAALAGGGLTALDAMRATPGDQIAGDVRASGQRIAARLGAQLHATRARADAIAMTPMLRAAIGTDAGTLEDMLGRDALFAAAQHEVIECFRWRDDRAVSLVRMPSGATPLAAQRDRTTRLERTERGVRVTASAQVTPLYRDEGLDGSLVLAAHVDAAALAGELPAAGIGGATLRGLARDLELTERAALPAAAPLTVALPLDPQWQLPALTLEVDVPAPRPTRLPAARTAALGIGLLCGACYVFGRRRHRWWRVRSPSTKGRL